MCYAPVIQTLRCYFMIYIICSGDINVTMLLHDIYIYIYIYDVLRYLALHVRGIFTCITFVFTAAVHASCMHRISCVCQTRFFESLRMAASAPIWRAWWTACLYDHMHVYVLCIFASMLVCMHVYIYTHTHIIYMYMHVCMYVCMHACT